MTTEIESMLQVNKQQKEFYESRYAASGQSREKAANAFTNVWTWMRRRQLACRQSLGIQDAILKSHRDWIANVNTPQRRVLDLGCFSGNALSLELAQQADSYLGVDLSVDATATLQERLRQAGLINAKARAMDFLENDFEDNSFDLVYAHSVLHHFRYFDCLLKELNRICSPGAVVISVDPMTTSWSIRLARCLYRPFQSDKDWEFPFNRRTLRTIGDYFNIKQAQGIVGFAKYPMPLMMVPGLQSLGRRLCMWGHSVDQKRAVRPGFFLHRCLQVTMCLQKRERLEE